VRNPFEGDWVGPWASTQPQQPEQRGSMRLIVDPQGTVTAFITNYTLNQTGQARGIVDAQGRVYVDYAYPSQPSLSAMGAVSFNQGGELCGAVETYKPLGFQSQSCFNLKRWSPYGGGLQRG
jgi:hypothetical protein